MSEVDLNGSFRHVVGTLKAENDTVTVNSAGFRDGPACKDCEGNQELDVWLRHCVAGHTQKLVSVVPLVGPQYVFIFEAYAITPLGRGGG